MYYDAKLLESRVVFYEFFFLGYKKFRVRGWCPNLSPRQGRP
jgi:hypothetical protein